MKYWPVWLFAGAGFLLLIVWIVGCYRWAKFTGGGKLRYIDARAGAVENLSRRNDFLERLLITQEQRLAAITTRIEELEANGR